MPAFKSSIQKLCRYFGYTLIKWEAPVQTHSDFGRLKTVAESLSSVKLHFGCGPRVLKGWLNIDLAYEPFENYLQYYTDKHYPESIRGGRDDLFVIDILKTGLPLPDESVDLIFHEDFLEHLSQKDQIIFLAETFRVLKKGAVHRVNTPNLRASMRDHSDFSKGKKGVYLGEWDHWEHFSVLSPAILKEMSEIVGYSSIQFNVRDKSIAVDLLPTEYRPDEKDRPAQDSNVFADLVK